MKYEINGQVVETDKELSESEIDEIGQQIGGSTSQANTGQDVSAQAMPAQPSMKDKLIGMAKKAAPYVGKAVTAMSAVEPALGPIGAMAGAVNAQQISQTLGQPAQKYVADPTQAFLEEKGVPKPAAYVGGQIAAIPADPNTYLMGSLGKKVLTAAAESGAAKAVSRWTLKLSGVPEEASRVLMETADLFKQATGKPEAIEGAVSNVTKALQNVLKKEGQAIGKVEEKIGISKSPEQLIEEMANGTETGGYIARLAKMGVQELFQEYSQLKQLAKDPSNIVRLRELQQELTSRVKFSNAPGAQPIGDSITGLLKTAAKNVGNQIKEMPGGAELREVQAQYARARKMYDTMQPFLKDPGKAEAFLENVFKSESATYKTIRNNLAVLEKLTGEPVMTDLFKEFAAKHLNKWVGGSGKFGSAMLGAAAGMAKFNPIGAAVPAALALSQSPHVMSRGINLAQKAAGPIGAVGGAAAASGAQQLYNLFDRNSHAYETR